MEGLESQKQNLENIHTKTYGEEYNSFKPTVRNIFSNNDSLEISSTTIYCWEVQLTE